MATGGKASGTHDAPPTFFTSFSDRETDRSAVRKFHERLEWHVKIYMGDNPAPRGFISTGMTPGASWNEVLIRACCTAKVLVALLTDDYVLSTWCAKEWAIFAERLRRAVRTGSSAPPCLLPVRWVPLRRSPPAEVTTVQSLDWVMPDDYREGGLFSLMRFAPRQYEAAVDRLAKLVVEAADHDLPALPVAEGHAIAPAFGLSEPGRAERPAPVPSAGGVVPAPVSVDHRADTVRAVAELLSQVTALDTSSSWRAFLGEVGRRRGRRVLTDDDHEPLDVRSLALVRRLVQQRGPKVTYRLLADALRSLHGSSAEGSAAAAAITAIAEGLPDGGSH